MVSVKQAVESAAAFAKGILGDERMAGLQLEEVELGKYMDRDAWQITLRMVRPNSFGQASNSALGPPCSLSLATTKPSLSNVKRVRSSR
jgi:hypothetical protein